jgi:hypothetical protein
MKQDDSQPKEPIVIGANTVMFGFIVVVLVAFAGYVIGNHFGNL